MSQFYLFGQKFFMPGINPINVLLFNIKQIFLLIFLYYSPLRVKINFVAFNMNIKKI